MQRFRTKPPENVNVRDSDADYDLHVIHQLGTRFLFRRGAHENNSSALFCQVTCYLHSEAAERIKQLECMNVAVRPIRKEFQIS